MDRPKPRLIAAACMMLAASIACLAPAASAAEQSADGQLWEEAKLAQSYWAVRGYDTCELVIPSIAQPPVPDDYVNDDVKASEAEEWSALGSCAVALVPEFAAITRDGLGDYFELRYECAVVVHGVGHALGLDHDAEAEFPVMGQGFWDEAIPGRCRAWARDEVRERKAQVRAARKAKAKARASR